MKMKQFWFSIRRTHNSAFEKLMIEAIDSEDAIRSLPPCAVWDFCKTPA